MIKRFIMITLLSIISFVCISCSNQMQSTDSGYKTKIVRINLTTNYGTLILNVMNQADILSKYLPADVTVEWTTLLNSNDIRDALVSNQTDIAVVSSSSFITSINNDAPITLINNAPASSAKLYSKNPLIKTVDDIGVDTKISTVSIAGSPHLAFYLYCHEKYNNALKYESNFVGMAYADTFASLVSGDDLDCAIFSFPNLTKADEIDNLTPILDLTPIMISNHLGTYHVTSQKFYEENPTIIEAVSKALEETIAYVNGNPSEVASLLKDTYVDIHPSDMEKHILEMPITFEISESAYDNISNIMHEAKIIPTSPKKFSELPNYNDIPKIR